MKKLLLFLLIIPCFIHAQVQVVTLDASKSTDSDGHIVHYKWVQIGTTPSLCTITNDTMAKATVVPSGGAQWQPGTYIFQNTVTDDQGASSSAQTHVTWSATNPTVAAGLDQTIQLPVTTVNLKATGVTTFGKVKSWTWTQISGANTAIFNRKDTSIATVSGLVAGVYNFQIALIDIYNQVGTDQVTVIVKTTNKPPTANAGNDQSILLPTGGVASTHVGGTDIGESLVYNWSKVSGKNAYTIVSQFSPETQIQFTSPGTYVFRKTVTNLYGSGYDNVTVTVKRKCSWWQFWCSL